MKTSNENYFLIGGVGVGLLIILAFIFLPSNESTPLSFETKEPIVEWNSQDLNAEIIRLEEIAENSLNAEDYFILGFRYIDADVFSYFKHRGINMSG